MHLKSDQVKKVAKLANLQISEQEVEKYEKQLSQILDYIDLLEKVDTKDIKPTFNVTGVFNHMSSDTVLESLTADEAMQNAKNKRNGYFVTKGVFDNE